MKVRYKITRSLCKFWRFWGEGTHGVEGQRGDVTADNTVPPWLLAHSLELLAALFIQQSVNSLSVLHRSRKFNFLSHPHNNTLRLQFYKLFLFNFIILLVGRIMWINELLYSSWDKGLPVKLGYTVAQPVLRVEGEAKCSDPLVGQHQ